MIDVDNLDCVDVDGDTKGQREKACEQGPFHLVSVALFFYKYPIDSILVRKMFLRGDSVILGMFLLGVQLSQCLLTPAL